MKDLRTNPFKKLSLAIVQISLIAGSIAVGVNSSCSSLSLIKSAPSCYQNCSEQNQTDGFVQIDNNSHSLKLSKLISFIVKEKASSSLFFKEPDLSKRSGLSPPSLQV